MTYTDIIEKIASDNMVSPSEVGREMQNAILDAVKKYPAFWGRLSFKAGTLPTPEQFVKLIAEELSVNEIDSCYLS